MNRQSEVNPLPKKTNQTNKKKPNKQNQNPHNYTFYFAIVYI